MEKGLRLSKKHGVNPSVQQCFVCMQDMGVILFGKINTGRKAKPSERDLEAPLKVCLGPDSEPCDECKDFMKQGIVLISVDPAKTEDSSNPWRTGGWCVVKEEAVSHMINDEGLLNHILNRRMAFVDDETWDSLELPRGEVKSGDN